MQNILGNLGTEQFSEADWQATKAFREFLEGREDKIKAVEVYMDEKTTYLLRITSRYQ
ncbi:hypothetical protein VCHA51O444_130087 [Vibrio chagasii]|nr:hypothetical protein VCHA51O444_130087 [Vibrio chagasii]